MFGQDQAIGKQRPKPRTGTEYNMQLQVREHHAFPTMSCFNGNQPPSTISDYMVSVEENFMLFELKSEIHTYMLQKVAVAAKQDDKCMINLQDYFSCTRAMHTEKSTLMSWIAKPTVRTP